MPLLQHEAQYYQDHPAFHSSAPLCIPHLAGLPLVSRHSACPIPLVNFPIFPRLATLYPWWTLSSLNTCRFAIAHQDLLTPALPGSYHIFNLRAYSRRLQGSPHLLITGRNRS
jgi:hypothetical protein